MFHLPQVVVAQSVSDFRLRNAVLELWEVHRYGTDSYGDADYVSIYGMRPADAMTAIMSGDASPAQIAASFPKFRLNRSAFSSGICSASFSKACHVLSVEPSSTTIISIGNPVFDASACMSDRF